MTSATKHLKQKNIPSATNIVGLKSYKAKWNTTVLSQGHLQYWGHSSSWTPLALVFGAPRLVEPGP